MRSGACAAPQTLTAEAASVLKHSLSLARRRGHAQVTPLHVAATLLSSRASLLRRACLKSQPHQTSHPLQCRALELCFNVALNRLPTTPGPLLHGQPSLSNALIAALKRAQAHQRRGCIEQQQQQPLLTIKVELEQLIISILDDPSVSRVMREAGFSSTAVKNNIEDSSATSVFQCYNSSGGVFSSPCSPSPTETQRDIINPSTFWQTHFLTYSSEQNPVLFSPQKKVPTNPSTGLASVKEDIKLVFEVLLRKDKRKNTVIVGDSVPITEGLVAEFMSRLDRGEVPEELKSTHLIKFQFAPVSLRFMKKEDVEMSLSELKRQVDSLTSGGSGAIVYTGDLKWTVETTINEREGDFSSGDQMSGYNPVDHLVAEIGRLVSGYGSSNTKVWLMATASYQTYMRCQIRQPPLEVQWTLQAVSVPSGGLGLSLHSSSVLDSNVTFSRNPYQMVETKPFSCKEEQEDKLACCTECASSYEKEADLFKTSQQKLLPPWLQPQGTEARQKDEMVELRRKWNRLCLSQHQGRHSRNNMTSALYNNQSVIGKSYTPPYPWWPSQNSIFPHSNSISFANSALKSTHSSNLVPRFRRQQSCTIEFNFNGDTQKHQSVEPSLHSLKDTDGKDVKITLALGNSIFSDSAKLVEQKSERTMQRADTCKLLQENVPWQSDTIPSIAEAMIDSKLAKQETWLLIQGEDSIGKRRLARAIAESILGSADFLLHMDMKKRDDELTPCSDILTKALKNNGQLVVLVEDIDLADTQFMKFLADRYEAGKFGESSKSERSVGRAIFILTKGGSTSYEDKKNVQDFVIKLNLEIDETKPVLGTPKFDLKRKPKWDFSSNTKCPRIEEKEDASSAAAETGNGKKDFSRQSSFNTLDLNLIADENDESEDKTGEHSPISSDLTRETTTDPRNPHGFLELIENRYVFDRSPARDREMIELFISKIKGSFEEVCGKQNMGSFSVEERVLEEVLVGSASFPNSLFEKWLKDIFQTSLQTVKFGGKRGMSIRLCLDGKGEGILEDGFLGSCLPKKIQVSNYMD
ncbi:hypothetical protein I3760_07G195100 [Carya illinoinensis]|nr:hypothetical protein I3760_07G195100 [Carya illinoinensis]